MILKNINKIYANSSYKKHALVDNSISFPNKGLIFISGKSGSGKSTLLNILGCIDRPNNGEFIINGINLNNLNDCELAKYRNSYFGFVFQEYNLIETLNVYDNVKIALDLKGEIQNAQITKSLNAVGLYNFERKKISECSGGEKQRISIARALIKNPNIILCDEPTGALDTENSNAIMTILKEISKKRLVIVVSHDTKLASVFADDVIELSDGKIVKNLAPIKKEASNAIKIQKSNLSLKNIIKYSMIENKLHPIRFISNIILLSLSFLMFIFSITLLTQNDSLIYSNTVKNTDYQYIKLNKQYDSYEVNINKYDLQYLNEEFQLKPIGVIENEMALSNVSYEDDLIYYNVSPRGYTYSIFFDNDNYKIIGHLPIKDNEIAVSSFFEEIICHNGLIDKKITTTIGEKIKINGSYYTVTGIIETKIPSKFEILKNILYK